MWATRLAASGGGSRAHDGHVYRSIREQAHSRGVAVSGATLQDLSVCRIGGGDVQLMLGNIEKVIVRHEDAALSEDDNEDES